MLPRRLPDWRALLLAAAAVCAAPAQASLTGLDEVASPALATSLQTELPGPCDGELCDELEVPQPQTRVRGFELDLHCRLGGEDGLSCRPRQVWLEEYGEGASDRLVYAKARYFDPELGRFLSQDSYLGELTEPPSLHRYLYAWDRPTYFIDADGHEVSLGEAAEREKARRAGLQKDEIGEQTYTNQGSGCGRRCETPGAPLPDAQHGFRDWANNEQLDPEMAALREQANLTDAEYQMYLAYLEAKRAEPSLAERALDRTGEALSYLPNKAGEVSHEVMAPLWRKAWGADQPLNLNEEEAAHGEHGTKATFRRVQEGLAEHSNYANDIVIEKSASGGQAIVLAKVLARVAQARKALQEPKTRIVYSIRDAEGRVIYVGRASGSGTPQQVLMKRRSSHVHKNDGDFHVEEANQSYGANRGAEDVLFQRERLSAEAEGRQLLNKDNPVGPRNPRRRRYVEQYYEEWRGAEQSK